MVTALTWNALGWRI